VPYVFVGIYKDMHVCELARILNKHGSLPTLQRRNVDDPSEATVKVSEDGSQNGDQEVAVEGEDLGCDEGEKHLKIWGFLWGYLKIDAL